MADYEKLGEFYLGRIRDMERGTTGDAELLYDSKDLTTHAVCLGMTGSGKTGLCLSLLEEAAIDGIPAIAIDPKGDLGNLFLTFPELRPEDFRPWVDASEAARKGMTPEEFAAKTAKMWREGLAAWGQPPERIKKFRDAVDLSIYTPGSNAGFPLTVLRSFDAPSQAVRDDADAFRERVTSAASGLLALLGIDADPVRSREHILVATIFSRAWEKGENLDVAKLIGAIQKPQFDKVGVMDLETFYPPKERMELAMTLNNLLASPSFASWMEGEPLDVKRLLYTEEGKPRLSIISIAHLSDPERMFFVTILLNEILAWVRGQAGTSSLRALLYMDEVFGYFPPTANPPSKPPMLTLLKQARAYGLGVVLATQNPVDLDYKGLSNTGTWFLGRLQAERDKMRVLEGLEGASVQAGSTFDRQKMEATLAGLSSRVFLMNNVHDDHPVVFETRWAMSYLRGPLTRQQIKLLMDVKKEALPAPEEPMLEAPQTSATPQAPAESKANRIARPTEEPGRLAVPPDVDVFHLRLNGHVSGNARLVYRPALLGRAKLHFVSAKSKVDVWRRVTLLQQIGSEPQDDVWAGAPAVEYDQLDLDGRLNEDAALAELPAAMSNTGNYTDWSKHLKSHLYSSQNLEVYRCTELKQYSEAGESEGDFRIRLAQVAREKRDLQVEKLRKKYASKAATLQGRMRTAAAAVDREKSQASRAALDTALSFGSTLLGALVGRKLGSRTNVTRASTSLRTAGRAKEQHGDIQRAREKLASLQQQVKELDAQLKAEVEKIEDKFDVDSFDFEQIAIRPRKSDIDVIDLAVVWAPWKIDSSGIAEPLWNTP